MFKLEHSKGLLTRPVATLLKVVRRKSERVPPARVGESTRGGIPPLVRGVRGTSPKKIFNLWLPLCAFLMHFGCVLAGILAEAIRTTVVPIRILIRTTVVPIMPLIDTTVVRIRILIGTTGI